MHKAENPSRPLGVSMQEGLSSVMTVCMLAMEKLLLCPLQASSKAQIEVHEFYILLSVLLEPKTEREPNFLNFSDWHLSSRTRIIWGTCPRVNSGIVCKLIMPRNMFLFLPAKM